MPKRKGPSDRRFSMRDVMILVASAAVAFAIVAPLQNGFLQHSPQWALYLTYYVVGLMALTPAALGLRLIGPRPPMHRLTRQPGFAASVAGSVILALGLLAVGLLALIRLIRADLAGPSGGPPPPLGGSVDSDWWVEVVLYLGPVVGPAVIATWVMLALSGRRRPAGSWIDYLGRGLGVGWIILFVIDACARLASSID